MKQNKTKNKPRRISLSFPELHCLVFYSYCSSYRSLPYSIVISVHFPSGLRAPGELRLCLFCTAFSHPHSAWYYGGLVNTAGINVHK